MDMLAFLHSYRAYEDTHGQSLSPALPSLRQLLPSSGWIDVSAKLTANYTAIVVAIAIASIPTSTLAMVDSGDTGEAVQQVQSTLLENGYQAGNVDGKFGPQTQAAVIQFQKNNQLAADGIVGPKTASAMGLADPNDTSNSYATNQATTLRVTTNRRPLNVRSGPGIEYSVVNSLAKGSVVQASNNRSGNWQQLANGGWVHQRWVTVSQQPTTTATAATATTANTTGNNNWRISTNGSPLNVRSRPSLNAPVINTVANGSVVAGEKQQNGWIALPSGGWISSQWTTATNTNPSNTMATASTNVPTGNTVRVNTNGNRLNVRSGPGVNYPVVNSLAPNTTTRTNGSHWRKLGSSGNWVQLADGNWVASQWIAR